MTTTNALKLTNLKALFTKAAMVGLVAGAVFMAAPQKANAQIVFGVRIGHARVGYIAPAPVYVAPAYGYYGPSYYAAPAYGYRYDHRGWDRHDRRFYR